MCYRAEIIKALRKAERKWQPETIRRIVACSIIVAMLVVMSLLSGCAIRNYETIMYDCQALQRGAKANIKICETVIGEVDCNAEFPIPNCEVEITEWNNHEDAVLRRKEKREAKGYCASQRMVQYCTEMGCSCVSRDVAIRAIGSRRY